MRKKSAFLLLLIFFISVTALGNSSSAFLGDSPGAGPISLEGSDELIMPKMSFPDEAKAMELFSHLPVYSLNQSIKGAFLFPIHGEASNISVCISPFDLSSYLSGYRGTKNFRDGACAKTIPKSNGSTDINGTSFQLSSTSSGMHSLNFVDEDNSSMLMSMPWLITDGQTVLQVPRTVKAQEPFIQVKLNTILPGNQSKIFAAIMILRKDYENASLGMAMNETSNSLDLTLSLGSKSLQIYGPLKISSELLMNLLPLLPANSAVGLQESTQTGVDLALLTDKPWEKGEYILTGGIYSPGKGLLGIKQQEVEVI
ncbi:MAG: hypothetical protein PHW87_02980 [Methanothrix sp.]|nr:hypothetical protein [Methanothrix sp.]